MYVSISLHAVFVSLNREIDNHLQEAGLPLSHFFNGFTGPRIEVVSEHLSSSQLVMFYRACDSFVLPTHGEGIALSLALQSQL